ncbi:hypothetical protein Vadar_004384 [Vaccinium darrowii]|uniref:Uncharacterized protein n=1 Tax=Vaccinium darrowii TaxID=229202 RepID=A0ACB7YL60_9ERIC|nr:hypothetical protein Vadar_004384 [Vaccinium darrowii]
MHAAKDSLQNPNSYKVQMHIINGVPDNPKPLQLHCASADDDIGTRVLINGEELDWHFNINFFGTTLYHCHFNWDSKDKSIVVFKVKGSTHWHYCNQCYWLVKPDGFYFRTDGSNWEKNYDWD